MRRELVNPIRDLFDAAVRHETIKVSCQCGNVGIFDPHALWYLFERRGWNDRLADAGYSRVEAAVAATAVKDCFGVGTGRSAVRGTNAKEKVLKRPVRNSILWVSNDAEIADIVHIGARRREHPGSK